MISREVGERSARMKNSWIRSNLLDKYSNSFNYYSANPIDEILFSQTHSQLALDFQQMVALADDCEHMKSIYSLKSNLGRKGIMERMKIIVDFYSRGLVMTFEYPTMVLTKTQSIMERRMRRIHKMQAADASSDSSRSGFQPDSGIYEYSEIIKALDGSWMSMDKFELHSNKRQKGGMQNMADWEDSFTKMWDIKAHNIYESPCIPLKRIKKPRDLNSSRELAIQGNLSQAEGKQKSSSSNEDITTKQGTNNVLKIDLNQTEGVNYLICAFDDLDEKKIEKEYELLKMKRRGYAYTLRMKDESIEQLNRKYPRSYERLLERRLSKGLKNDNEESITNPWAQVTLPDSSVMPSQEQYQMEIDSGRGKIRDYTKQQEKIDKQIKRQLLRDKAAELLKRKTGISPDLHQ